MKKAAALFLAAAVAVLASCNDGLSSKGGHSSGQNERRDKSARTIIDAGDYVDLTLEKNNARTISKADVLYKTFGTFKIEGGNSVITVNRNEGTITMSSDDAFYDGREKRQFYAKFSFEVAAASADCLYMRIGKKDKATMIVDNLAFENQSVPDIAVCLPLYGFGSNRIEVSSVMNGFIAMPSGTYWKQK